MFDDRSGIPYDMSLRYVTIGVCADQVIRPNPKENPQTVKSLREVISRHHSE